MKCNRSDIPYIQAEFRTFCIPGTCFLSGIIIITHCKRFSFGAKKYSAPKNVLSVNAKFLGFFI